MLSFTDNGGITDEFWEKVVQHSEMNVIQRYLEIQWIGTRPKKYFKKIWTIWNPKNEWESEYEKNCLDTDLFQILYML